MNLNMLPFCLKSLHLASVVTLTEFGIQPLAFLCYTELCSEFRRTARIYIHVYSTTGCKHVAGKCRCACSFSCYSHYEQIDQLTHLALLIQVTHSSRSSADFAKKTHPLLAESSSYATEKEVYRIIYIGREYINVCIARFRSTVYLR